MTAKHTPSVQPPVFVVDGIAEAVAVLLSYTPHLDQVKRRETQPRHRPQSIGYTPAETHHARPWAALCVMPRWIKAVVAVVGIAMVLAGGTYLRWQMNGDKSLLSLDGHSYHISVMRTEAELEKGLSGTTSLPADKAMVFVFPTADEWDMWMEDMRYPIDILWLNDNKEVIYNVKDAQPSSYPTIFEPDKPARYVIELPSGTTDKTGIKNGDRAGLPSGV